MSVAAYASSICVLAVVRQIKMLTISFSCISYSLTYVKSGRLKMLTVNKEDTLWQSKKCAAVSQQWILKDNARLQHAAVAQVAAEESASVRQNSIVASAIDGTLLYLAQDLW